MKPVRNKEAVISCLKELDNGAYITTKQIKIQFPIRFKDIKLAILGETSYVFGLFAIFQENNYTLLSLNCYIELAKAKIEKSVINDVEYYNFVYEPGDVVFNTLKVVARSNLLFIAIDEFVFKGKMPWYVSYEDAGQLFETAVEYAGTSAKIIPEVEEFFAAYIARSKEDRSLFIREVAQNYEDYDLTKISWVPFRSIYWSSPGTVNKLAGAYFNDGIVAALVNPSNKVERIESVIRA